MKLDYFRRRSWTTITEEARPAPSVWQAIKFLALRFIRGPLRKALLPLVGIILVVQLVERMGWFEHLQAVAADTFSRGWPHAVPKNMLLVEITDEDYKTLFGESSPLDPAAVMQLVDSVRQLNPAVIGVDLDTRDSRWACTTILPELVSDPNIIWAEVPKENREASAEAEPGGRAEATEPIELQPVLGGQLSDPGRMGVVRFPLDADSFVRSFRTVYPVKNDLPAHSSTDAAKCHEQRHQRDAKFDVQRSLPGPMPAFFDAVARRAKGGLPQSDSELQYLKFSGDRYDFQIVQASEFIRVKPSPPTKAKNEQRASEKVQVEKTPIPPNLARKLSDKIVLIGGSYGAGRDEYMTAMGKMQGIELLANGVESELNKGISLAWPVMLVLLDVFAGIGIVFIHYQCKRHPGWALALSVGAMAVVVVLGAFSYYGLGAFLNIVPVMFGMWVHQMYEETKEIGELHEELDEREAKIKELQDKLAQAPGAAEAPPLLAPPVPAAAPSATESDPPVRKTVVETEVEQVHVERATRARPHRRGHASGR